MNREAETSQVVTLLLLFQRLLSPPASTSTTKKIIPKYRKPWVARTCTNVVCGTWYVVRGITLYRKSKAAPALILELIWSAMIFTFGIDARTYILKEHVAVAVIVGM